VRCNSAAKTLDQEKSAHGVSVCILSFNRPQFLHEAVQSVLSQSYRPSEIIIFDNGSDNGVKKSVTMFLEQGVKWEGSAVPHSVSWNWNRVMSKTSSKYLYIMHDDDRLCSHFLAEQVGFLERHPDAVAVACDGYLMDVNGNRTGQKIYDKASRSGVEWYTSGAELAALYSKSFLVFPSIVYRNLFPQRVQFREEFGKVIDAVFLLELADLGKIGHQNKALFEYRRHPGQDSTHFPERQLAALEELLIHTASGNKCLAANVRRNLRIRHTTRLLFDLRENIRRRALLSAFQDLRTLLKPVNLSMSTLFRSLFRSLVRK